jgi:hypothetical protein
MVDLLQCQVGGGLLYVMLHPVLSLRLPVATGRGQGAKRGNLLDCFVALLASRNDQGRYDIHRIMKILWLLRTR